jgi:hypothetical protein
VPTTCLRKIPLVNSLCQTSLSVPSTVVVFMGDFGPNDIATMIR